MLKQQTRLLLHFLSQSYQHQQNDDCIKACEDLKSLFHLGIFCYLCNVLQPSTQSDEHEEHRWSVEEGDGALAGSLCHGYDEDHTGVDVGDRGG